MSVLGPSLAATRRYPVLLSVVLEHDRTPPCSDTLLQGKGAGTSQTFIVVVFSKQPSSKVFPGSLRHSGTGDLRAER